MADLLKKEDVRPAALVANDKRFRGKIDERTLRNDVLDIAQLKISRFHGGIRQATFHYHYAARTEHAAEKRDVAAAAAKEIPPNTSVAAGCGTTTQAAMAALRERGTAVVIVTGSLAVIEEEPAEGGQQVTLTGGEVNIDVFGLVGEDAIKGFKAHPCRYGLLGVSGIGPEGELYVHHAAETKVVQAMLASVQEKLLIVADVHKLAHRDMWQTATIGDLADLDRRLEVLLITNRLADWKSDWEKENNGRRDLDVATKTLEDLSKLHHRLPRFSVLEVPRSKPETRKRTTQGR
ncbi:MAG TPA: hypothetical protein VFH73_28415 [Polyangia bacterium]|nr:hypothetical protein [Polyangia bacterium]